MPTQIDSIYNAYHVTHGISLCEWSKKGKQLAYEGTK